MNKNFKLLLFSVIIPLQLQSQILPKEGSRLNYRLIGFTFPKVPQASGYKLEIARGNHKSVDSFKKNIVYTTESKTNKVIAEVPLFGSKYTWRVIYAGTKTRGQSLHHFATGMNEHVDTTKLRLRILQPAEAYKDAYVSVDAGGVLYDMNGRPVWYIPDTNGIDGNVADLQFTPSGTITFLYKNAYEIDYNGTILWKAPNTGVKSGDTVHGEVYHHEFSKLPNGHYMVLGMQIRMCKPVPLSDTSYDLVIYKERDMIEQNGIKRARFGTIIEYDKKGNIVWSWESLPYLLKSDFMFFDPADSNLKFDPHENAFYFDEKNKCIYLGYRNLNRIIKIEYPSGKVLNTYGTIYKPCLFVTPENILCNQHSIGRTHDGNLYVFDNNSCNSIDALPSIVVLEESASEKDKLKKVWEYTCTVEGNYPWKFTSGGNVIELPDYSFFVNMGTQYSKLFIVTREKRVLWSAFPERFMEPDEKWVPIHEYRANIISRKDLERLIWSAEKTK